MASINVVDDYGLPQPDLGSQRFLNQKNFVMAIQTCNDANGQPIGVFIPNQDWEKLKQECPDLGKKLFLDSLPINIRVQIKAFMNIPETVERIMYEKERMVIYSLSPSGACSNF